MLNQLLSLGSRRLLSIGLILAGALVAVLLIILWQLGVFDSPPPPAALQSAVESVRQEEQQEQQAAAEQSAQAQTAAQEQQETTATQDQSAQQQAQPTQDGAAQQQQAQSAQEQQQEVDAGYGYGDAQDEQQEQQTVAQTAQEQQAQQQAQEHAQEQAQEQAMSEEPVALADLAGTWTISERGTSFVGYRIGEELANIGTATAVGRTNDIVATLEFDGATITNVTIEADLRTLRSDQSFRDSALRTRGIESDTYPFATFVLAEPIPIDDLPVADATLSVTVSGTLDLHGVTNSVSIDLQGQYVDGLVVVAGSTEIALADYDIEPPTGFRVLSIDDVGIMEFELVFERAE